MPPPRRTGLGRGLSALIPAGTPGTQLEEIPVSQIRPNPNQPRVAFDEESLMSLTESIVAVGVLQPVLVRPVGAGYELIAGERRWRAAQRAGFTTIPAVIRTVEESSALEQALIENLHREDLNPLEEAAAYSQLIEDFGLTHEDVGQRVGRSRSTISNSLRLLALPAGVQARLADGSLSAGHARALLALEDHASQAAMAEAIVRQGLSVRATEEGVARTLAAGTPSAKKGTRAPSIKSASLLEVESSLSDRLATRVTVQSGGKRGRIVIDFGSMEDLDRIWRLLSGRSEDAYSSGSVTS